MTKVVMPLSKALYILAEFHTKDDDLMGFVIEMHPSDPYMNLTPFTRDDYYRAWESVRAHINRSVMK